MWWAPILLPKTRHQLEFIWPKQQRIFKNIFRQFLQSWHKLGIAIRCGKDSTFTSNAIGKYISDWWKINRLSDSKLSKGSSVSRRWISRMVRPHSHLAEIYDNFFSELECFYQHSVGVFLARLFTLTQTKDPRIAFMISSQIHKLALESLAGEIIKHNKVLL